MQLQYRVESEWQSVSYTASYNCSPDASSKEISCVPCKSFVRPRHRRENITVYLLDIRYDRIKV